MRVYTIHTLDLGVQVEIEEGPTRIYLDGLVDPVYQPSEEPALEGPTRLYLDGLVDPVHQPREEPAVEGPTQPVTSFPRLHST